jgi:TonB family protein
MQSRLFVLIAVLALTLFSPTLTARADDTLGLQDRLHAAEKDTSLTSDDVQPFYLKMSVQLFDAKGAPSEQGAVEVYWEGTQTEKIVYSFPSYTAIEVHANGSRYRTSGVANPPQMIPVLLQQVFHPLAGDADSLAPQSQQINLSKLPLDCIVTPGRSSLPVSFAPMYCFAPDNSLRVVRHGAQVVLRNSVTAFQQRHVSFDVSATTGGVQVAEGKVVALEPRTFPKSEFSKEGLPLFAEGVPSEDYGDPAPVRVSGQVIQGFLLRHVDSVYPASAKTAHVQGTVILRAQIGTDGHIQYLEVFSTPDTELSAAAMDAVRQWTYRPYMLNGSPVAVDTTINVNFTFGAH